MKGGTTVDIETDVILAQKGDKKAFIRLIKATEISMYRVGKAIVKTDSECADVIQNTILKAYESIQSLREPKYFKSWIIRIVINESKLLLKSNRRYVLFNSMESNIRGHVADSQRALEIQESVDALDSHLKMIAVLFYYEDLPVKEISRLLKVPEGTIKSRLFRIRETLTHSLKGTYERRASYE